MTTNPTAANTLTNADLDRIRAITGLKLDTQEPSKDPWNPNAAALRYAADVLHSCVGEIEVSEPGMPTDDAVSECVEALRWEADRADADELARIYYPHLTDAERAPVAEVWLTTLTEHRHTVAQERAL